MSTYRAAYLNFDRDSTVLTDTQHSGLSNDDLRAEALAEAMRAGIIDTSTDDEDKAWPNITRARFDECLSVGDWSDHFLRDTDEDL